jgi:hypothetical protein
MPGRRQTIAALAGGCCEPDATRVERAKSLQLFTQVYQNTPVFSRVGAEILLGVEEVHLLSSGVCHECEFGNQFIVH